MWKALSYSFMTALLFALPVVAQDKCFENSGLKDGHTIEFKVSGSKVSGEFSIARDFNVETTERYGFTGSKIGSSLSVKFTGKQPDSLPASPSVKKWALVGSGESEKLRVTLFGRNYNTNKWSNYTVDYKSCASPYAAASQTARRIAFAKGTSSWSTTLTFKGKDEKQSFWLGLRAGQKVSVTAPGCGISFFYPDKKPYEEGTAIDTWGSDSLPQTGDYVFVISPAGEPGTCLAKFEAK